MQKSLSKFKLFAVLFALFILICIVFLWKTIPSNLSKKIILQREWTANAEYAGDVWAISIAHDNGITLSVNEGSELFDPIRIVRVGDAHFGVASADRILQENEGGAELVIIASATYKTPVVFLSKKNSGILTPQDFLGKKVGIQTGTNTELVFKAIVASNDINENQIRVVESGWGIQTFLNDDIDVLGAFDYDETIQLDMQGVEYNVIRPEEFGVNYVGTVYFTRKDLVFENPKTVQDFLDFLVLGWKRAMENPNEAIKKLVAYNDDINASKESKSLIRGKEYFKGDNDRLLYSSEERWDTMTESLIKIGRLKSFDYTSNIDYRFLEIALAKIENGKND